MLSDFVSWFLPCSDNISTMSHESLNLLLDLYQQSRVKGEQASLFMETKNGMDVITFQIGYVPTGSSVRNSSPSKNSKKIKAPSQQRRNDRRKVTFWPRRTWDPRTLLETPYISWVEVLSHNAFIILLSTLSYTIN